MNIPELQATGSKQVWIQTGWASRNARPGIHLRTFYRKRGGEWVCYSFSEEKKGEDILPEEKKENDLADKCRSITVQHLIRAADFASARGQRCANGEDRLQLEELGITINILRRSRKIDLNLLASQIPCRLEELIALEAGLLPCERVCKLLPAVVRHLGVNLHSYVPETLKFVTSL
jgi:hypothetical protein